MWPGFVESPHVRICKGRSGDEVHAKLDGAPRVVTLRVARLRSRSGERRPRCPPPGSDMPGRPPPTPARRSVLGGRCSRVGLGIATMLGRTGCMGQGLHPRLGQSGRAWRLQSPRTGLSPAPRTRTPPSACRPWTLTNDEPAQRLHRWRRRAREPSRIGTDPLTSTRCSVPACFLGRTGDDHSRAGSAESQTDTLRLGFNSTFGSPVDWYLPQRHGAGIDVAFRGLEGSP